MSVFCSECAAYVKKLCEVCGLCSDCCECD